MKARRWPPRGENASRRTRVQASWRSPVPSRYVIDELPRMGTRMGWIRWLLVVVGVMMVVAELAADDTADADRSLPQAIAHLVEAQSQVQSACTAAGVVVPSGLTDVLIVRRTIAADWQRRVDSAAIRADDAGLLRFTGELESLVTGLQQLANLAQQLGDAPRRFPHCVNEPAFARYRTMVTAAVDQGMQAVSAGRLRDQGAPAAWYQRQSRHTALLSLIEASHTADERYAKLRAMIAGWWNIVSTCC